MSRKKTIDVFTYAELEGTAKERARDWFLSGGSDFDPECEIDEFKTVLHALGFNLDDKKVFWDINPIDAAWHSSWSAERCAEQMRHDARRVIVADRPQAAGLHDIIARIETLAADYSEARAETSSYRRHIGLLVESQGFDDEGETQFHDACADLAHWFARSINAQYEYEHSDEYVAEAMAANEYEFDADGRIA